MTVALALWIGAAAFAQEPCGDVELVGGLVVSDAELAAAAPLDDVTTACVARIGEDLRGRAGLRTVTVTVRVGPEARVDGSGERILAAYSEALAEAGIPDGRISGVVGAGEGAGEVFIGFTERRDSAAVGSVRSSVGAVRGGDALDTLTALSAGASITPDTWVSTGSDGTAVLALLDGSRVRLHPDSELYLGRMHLDDELQRVVELDLSHGSLETEVAPGGTGSTFEVSTAWGTAGVRGTTLRVAVEDGASRVETLEGTVVLAGSGGDVALTDNRGARVGADGHPSDPVRLPRAPRARAPLEGPLPAAGLQWRRVGHAEGYVVEIAEDAEFMLGVHRLVVGADETAARPAMPAGRWYWRVAAVDDDGYGGAWSYVYGFDAR